ncbi:Succinyl-CoA ligase like flavodoxin domain-containing protein [Paractinoplanes atraurantiacus]|uniref:Succinyl-CoA ligase like flavodoxin domain-containing protein n=2 Tax=Paractinoplanes atraurantiacus TaxID=1036182 RepID=A0A285JGD4_9ACTN|nr:Succinyl-CoA ligase like flavodoxin domain-containing protein [Actinoplanes atraurantiacus]
MALLEHVTHDGCGVASFVPLEDGLDGELNDFWRDDPHTRAVGLYLNSAADHATFTGAAHGLLRRKPVLTIAGGHPRAVALCSPPGVVRTTSLDELTDAARMLVDQPLPAGNRLAVVGNAGGLAVIAADAARAYGFAEPGEHRISLGPDATPPEIAEAVEAVACGGRADIIVVMIVGTRTNVPAAMTTAVADILDQHPELTAAAVLTGGADDVHRIGARGIPVYREHDRAIRALAHAHRYATWRRDRD